ncbi:hypothetical protein N8148_03105 [Gammaproteobacteria bacterium]|nr:hypothetical protein [Gammaproteobacteria bacterium]
MPDSSNGALLAKIEALEKAQNAAHKTFLREMKDGFAGVYKRQDYTNGNVTDNTEYRLKATGSITALKYVIGIMGISNVAVWLKIFL